MRPILTTMILTMLAQPVWAVTTLELYETCKPYANNGFAFSGLNDSQQEDALNCIYFQAGVIHIGYYLCEYAKNDLDRQQFGTSITSNKILIQWFLNWAEANPDLWNKTTDPSQWIQGTCEAK